MSKLSKFEDVDVFAYLQAIMKQNTGFFQSDFEIDKAIIQKAAASQNREDKTLLWLSRPSGTHCFRERDVFLKDTAPHNTWRFHHEQTRDRILAYAVELTGIEGRKIKGSIYELDYSQHYERVKEKELPADTNALVYEYRRIEQPTKQWFNGDDHPKFGKFERFETLPNDPEALRDILQEEKRSRDKLTPGNFAEHIAALHDGLIQAEAQHIVNDMKRLYTPNSPNKTHFMVQLSPAFMMIAPSKDTERLAAMLPYKTLALSTIKDRDGIYAQISKDENRDKDIRKPRPSIRAQLAADTKKAAPKKAAVKTKHHDMEV